MAPVRNARVVFAKPPTGFPKEGEHLKYDTSATIDVENVALKGGVLLRNLLVSIDPYQRGRMRPPGIPSYIEEFPLGEAITNHGIGKVLRSDDPIFKKGDVVFSQYGGFEEYTLLTKEHLKNPQTKVLENKEGLDWETWIGACGMPGHTAYYGFYEIGKPKKGETIFISAASGAVGQIVGQLARREGLKVIGTAGSDEKVKYLKDELKFDHAFNYKTADVGKELDKYGGIDIYYDNVGGEILDVALTKANRYARFIECGMISQYNGASSGIKNLIMTVAKSIRLQGFIILDEWAHSAPKFYRDVPSWVKKGEIKDKRDVTKGLENAAGALIGIFEGKNFGKASVRIWDGK